MRGEGRGGTEGVGEDWRGRKGKERRGKGMGGEGEGKFEHPQHKFLVAPLLAALYLLLKVNHKNTKITSSASKRK
jgi:hypothetical protein